MSLLNSLSFLKQQPPPIYLVDIVRGIEKENLRVTPLGKIAQTDHPASLGSALTHPSITTDFSESLLEMVTPPVKGIPRLVQELSELQALIYRHLDQELLWPASMPPWVNAQDEIRLAYYGTSNSGTLKHVYRLGLSYRYGRIMQAIAGIHYNISFPDALFEQLQAHLKDTQPLMQFRSNRYLGTIRTYFRHYWLLAYLFGASPICMKSSVKGEVPDFLTAVNPQTLIGQYATCLRMSRLGYQNAAQSQLNIQFNDLTAYADSLLAATRLPHQAFSEIGVKVDGEYRQLNDSILQIENEYYSPIRPKQIVERCERPATALKARGVAYLEVRVTDLNPLLPLGIDASQIAFMDVFMMYCVLMPQDNICFDRCQNAWNNFALVATEGRKPRLTLKQDCEPILMKDWAASIFTELLAIAEWMDQGVPGNHYQQAVLAQQEKVDNVELTPSAQVLAELSRHGNDYTALCLAMATRQKQSALSTPLSVEQLARYQQWAQESWDEQHALEINCTVSFETYLKKYLEECS
jgi:glutamate--cysteine ligase